MTQDELFEQHLQELEQYVKKYRRFPSKHRIEDHKLLNWMKYVRKQLKAEQLSADRASRFVALLERYGQYRKLNQYSYIKKKSDEGSLFGD